MRKIQRSKQNKLDKKTKLFSTKDDKFAIAALKNSSTIGPDGLTMLHMKHLGPKGLRYFMYICNNSVQHANIPSIWKAAHIIPLPKPGKPAEVGTSFRSISLLCAAAKVLEKMLLPHISPHLTVTDAQHGFRSGRSCITAILPIISSLVDGFNKRKPVPRMIAATVDVSKAFNSVGLQIY